MATRNPAEDAYTRKHVANLLAHLKAKPEFLSAFLDFAHKELSIEPVTFLPRVRVVLSGRSPSACMVLMLQRFFETGAYLGMTRRMIHGVEFTAPSESDLEALYSFSLAHPGTKEISKWALMPDGEMKVLFRDPKFAEAVELSISEGDAFPSKLWKAGIKNRNRWPKAHALGKGGDINYTVDEGYDIIDEFDPETQSEMDRDESAINLWLACACLDCVVKWPNSEIARFTGFFEVEPAMNAIEGRLVDPKAPLEIRDALFILRNFHSRKILPTSMEQELVPLIDGFRQRFRKLHGDVDRMLLFANRQTINLADPVKVASILRAAREVNMAAQNVIEKHLGEFMPAATKSMGMEQKMQDDNYTLADSSLLIRNLDEITSSEIDSYIQACGDPVDKYLWESFKRFHEGQIDEGRILADAKAAAERAKDKLAADHLDIASPIISQALFSAISRIFEIQNPTLTRGYIVLKMKAKGARKWVNVDAKLNFGFQKQSGMNGWDYQIGLWVAAYRNRDRNAG